MLISSKNGAQKKVEKLFDGSFSGKNLYQDLDSLITKSNFRIPEGKFQ
jgi:hypothetical protein